MPAWIPRKITDKIKKAIDATDRLTDVFYITGEGGDGKTILLRQIGMGLGSEDGIAPHAPWSGIMDLYHPEVNSNSGLETRLSDALETDHEFQKYRDARDLYAAAREAGLPAGELEDERTRIADVFTECMSEVTRWSRVVIALDTTERIQFERDRVQKLCDIESESTTVKAWLLDQLVQWGNCVVLLAGRPEEEDTPYLSKALAETLGADPRVRYHAVTLGGFSGEEATAYFQQKIEEYPDLEDIDAAFWDRLQTVTAGRPIRLELAIEVTRYGLEFDKFRREIEKGKSKQVLEKIDSLLIEHVMNGDPDESIRKVLRYLGVARRGLDAELLQYLSGEWDPDECQHFLDTIADRAFVKLRSEEKRSLLHDAMYELYDKRFFLHDVMYELCDKYLLPADEVQRLSGRVGKWYEQKLASTTDEELRERLWTDSLLYRMRANPREGYHWYAKQAEFAIRAAQVGYEMRLRSEVLAFVGSESEVDRRLLRDATGLVREINCDSASRWVKRLLARGDYKKAVQVAEKARTMGVCPLDDPKFTLAMADLDVYHAQALIYLGKVDSAVDMLKSLIARLETGTEPEHAASKDIEFYDTWRRNLVLGRAHNNLGYAYWMHQGHYNAALKEFRAALPYFRASEIREEVANTNDNMARVYALLRHPTRANTLVSEGLRLRREEGRKYRIGLSLNSQAIVHLEFKEALHGRPLAEQALSIFEDLGAKRGTGLALITLGRSLRQQGGLWETGEYSTEDCQTFLSHAASYLDRAIALFEGEVPEPIRLFEALSELGCTYRDRSKLAQSTADGPSSLTPLTRTSGRRAIEYMKKCVKLAEEYDFPAQYVDACEDMAETYFLLRENDNVSSWLDQANKKVPQRYRFQADTPPAKIPEEECVEAFWLHMGKVELLRGSLAFDRATDRGSVHASREVLLETAEHYMLSAAYRETYSERFVGVRGTFAEMFDRFKTCSSTDLDYLQNEALPSIVAKYSVDMSRAAKFLEDTFGLVRESGG